MLEAGCAVWVTYAATPNEDERTPDHIWARTKLNRKGETAQWIRTQEDAVCEEDAILFLAI